MSFQTMPAGYRTVAYFVNWGIYARNFKPQDLPAEQLTHVLYAFANVKPDTGEVVMTDPWADTDIHWEGDSWNDVGTNMYGCLKQLNLLKRKHRNMKVLLSVGGWTYSPNFRVPASTDAGRERFASSCVELVKNLGFDGIDVDWEYPANQAEGQDYVKLLRAVRQALDTYSASLPEGCGKGYHFELTVACPAGSKNFANFPAKEMDTLLDFWNLMAYDYAGSWDSVAAHQANLHACHGDMACTPFSTDAAVAYYTGQGVHPDKVVLGMPLYGRAFEQTEGLGKPFSGIGQGTWEAGVHDYKTLPLSGAQEHFDEQSGGTYSYDVAKKTLVSYDTPDMARRKADYVRKHTLGGAMWWEASADKKDKDSLINTVVWHLGGEKTLFRGQNCIDYPQSKYDNLRKGFAEAC